MRKVPARVLAVAAAAAGLGWGGAAQAQDWEFRAVPYVWISGVDGQAAALPGLPPANVDQSFGDILDNLDFAMFGVFDARNSDLLIRSDFAYASLNPVVETPGPTFSGIDYVTKTFNASLQAGYAVVNDENAKVDLLVGGRFWSIKNRLEFLPGTAPGVGTKAKVTFFDPIIGMSAEFPISERISGTATGSVGGFGVGADMEYTLSGGLAWAAGESWGLAAGYRFQSVDYDNDDGFIYDMDQSGPYVGAFFEF